MVPQLTPAEAHRLVEQECAKRGHRYGEQNEEALRLMRLEIAVLKQKPIRYARAMAKALEGLHSMGDGCYARGLGPRIKQRNRGDF